ncbi:MAG: segregation/condensation protein A [Longimonas sp.]|uniref:segregation and condensation protein A n=1 Tax=Longimonas sp. TaxID=2039626 RepID=UPI00335206AF
MYQVELQQFEGPLDLLLFFIKRDEIDIYDIPIAKITDEYLTYVRVLEEIDLDGVADFIYMAALLINIKAQMLLPNASEDEEGEEVDPRRELVERLLEYVRFKEGADQLAVRKEARERHATRGDASPVREQYEQQPAKAVDHTVYDLMKALAHMLHEPPETDDPIHEVEPLEYSVDEQQVYVMERLQHAEELSFRSIIRSRSKPFVIATFLAVLELARQHHLRVHVNESRTNFSLRWQSNASTNGVDSTLNGDVQ